jgi:hypothetical protein
MQFKILKGKKPEPLTQYPFAKMQIGDAFFMPCPRDMRPNVSTQVHNAARRFREKHQPGFRITVRSTHNTKGFGLLIHRIA